MRPTSRSVRRLSLLAVCAIALAGCGGQQADPKDYGEINDQGDGFYGNLMYGCTGVEPNDDGKYTGDTLAPADFCTCLWRGLEETVPFDDTKKFDEAQADAEAGEIEVPSNIAKVQQRCGEDPDSYS
jgi:hypothetical protein